MGPRPHLHVFKLTIQHTHYLKEKQEVLSSSSEDKNGAAKEAPVRVINLKRLSTKDKMLPTANKTDLNRSVRASSKSSIARAKAALLNFLLKGLPSKAKPPSIMNSTEFTRALNK